jgi:hypothetical protein
VPVDPMAFPVDPTPCKKVLDCGGMIVYSHGNSRGTTREDTTMNQEKFKMALITFVEGCQNSSLLRGHAQRRRVEGRKLESPSQTCAR